MTHLEKIKAACVASNEDIMKLQFGCEVITRSHLSNCEEKRKITWYENDNFATDTNLVDSENHEIIKILGRPIQIHDILLALAELCNPYSVDTEGNFWKYNYESENWDCKNAYWDMLKPLDDQSEETLAFIASLLP